MVRLTDAQIAQLIAEAKPLPAGYSQNFRLRPHRGHSERDLALTGVGGSDYKILLRQSLLNPLSFSAILAYRPQRSNTWFRLRRYNGSHGPHTNRIERDRFSSGCHIHFATARYQAIGMREDSYAELTTRFTTLESALQCLLTDCSLTTPPNQGGFSQGTLPGFA